MYHLALHLVAHGDGLIGRGFKFTDGEDGAGHQWMVRTRYGGYYLDALRRHAPHLPVEVVHRLDTGAMPDAVARARALASHSSAPPPMVPDCPSAQTSIAAPTSRGEDPLNPAITTRATRP